MAVDSRKNVSSGISHEEKGHWVEDKKHKLNAEHYDRSADQWAMTGYAKYWPRLFQERTPDIGRYTSAFQDVSASI